MQLLTRLGIWVGGHPKFGELVEGNISEISKSDLLEVSSIRTNAFSGLQDLNKVEIPGNITNIGDSAFQGCSNIETLVLEDGVTTIGSNAFNGINASEIVIPSTITTLEEGVFANNNSLTSIVIPENITELKDNVFVGCENLEEVTMKSSIPPAISSTAFPNNVTTINVPYGAYDDYVASGSGFEDKINKLPAIPSTITINVKNYIDEFISNVSVTITGNGQTFNGITNDSGVFVQGDLQPATYTISVGDISGLQTPATQEVVVTENSKNDVLFIYNKMSSFSSMSISDISQLSSSISSAGLTSTEVESLYGVKIGDTKEFSLSTGETFTMRIIGFNHDDLSDGSGKAGITLGMVDCLNTSYVMHPDNTNSGGFLNSYIGRQNAYGTLSILKLQLPAELQSAIKQVKKQTTKGSKGTYVSLYDADLFLLSTFEMTGVHAPAMTGSNMSEGTQYEYWINHNTNTDRIKYYDADGDDVPETATRYWLRSASNSTNGYCYVNESGVVANIRSNNTYRISFAFCV